MWQHRQEERVLKRAEMDVLKQRKNLEDTMRKLNTGNTHTAACIHQGPLKDKIMFSVKICGSVIISLRYIRSHTTCRAGKEAR